MGQKVGGKRGWEMVLPRRLKMSNVSFCLNNKKHITKSKQNMSHEHALLLKVINQKQIQNRWPFDVVCNLAVRCSQFQEEIYWRMKHQEKFRDVMDVIRDDDTDCVCLCGYRKCDHANQMYCPVIYDILPK